MTFFTRIVVLIVLPIILASCGMLDETGACEYRDDRSPGGPTFWCKDIPSGGHGCIYGDANHLHRDTTCHDLGYTTYYFGEPGNSTYAYNDELGQSPRGHSDLSVGGSPGSGSGGTVNLEVECAIDRVWSGDASDQFAYQCQQACAYRAEGYTQEAETICDILREADRNHGFNTVSQCSACN